MTDSIFFRPARGWVGDVIPLHHEGEYWLFYLHDRRDPAQPGTAWNLVRTRDFVEYEDAGVALPHGDASSQDLNAYTGSVVADGGRHHLFYTGYNPAFTDEATGTPLQVVMHAVSDDGMRSWTKLPEDTFGAPGAGYEPGDWRDPFVFRTSPGEPWRMLLAARRDSGPERRRGLIAECRSDDLRSWTTVEPFWDPSLYVAHECPDVFRIGDWWYLVYSEFSDRFCTRYRMARTPDGPWQAPAHDALDGRAFYAAKTAGDAGRRFAFGWIPSREDERDDGAWQWAGDLAVHELVQQRDGTLAVALPGEVRAAFAQETPTVFRPVLGTWAGDGPSWRAEAPDAYAVLVTDDDLPDQCLVSVVVDIAPGTTECGVLLRTSADGDEGYVVRLEPRRQRMVFDRWPRRRTGPMQWQISGDVPHAVELERPCDLPPGRHVLDIVVDGTACIAYLDGRVAMSARSYDRRGGGLGLFVGEGSASFTGITVTTRT
ncbi:family 43 glycosylhydrolase [Jiangella anatolica]|uniref:beta-fructofuranosidase n=1 Tax=Jiangella anatolica TaxID=2670374 RepID=A0A2W2C2F3_9ACTN|nr:family 43 glycosylhydrolase [Jiangella anatolica]PZF86288.1 glycoside hydrolase [Jiangella anatolica]